ncbi:TIGR03960 family B12-binding radical SAM protein [bacterium]|nr:TIGR03960 family B12-binding radical SAM protein [bacterium]
MHPTIDPPALTSLLARVRKPQRYAGSELNRIVKPEATVRWALGFPDLYEIGMSHQGSAILYHRINSLGSDFAAERVYLPDNDLSGLLRSEGVPLFTLETKTPLQDVDLLGVNLSTELSMPGVLELLDLGRIPIYASDRGEHAPIVVAGGALTYNPEPFAPFFDLVVVGEGEEVVEEISRTVLAARQKNQRRSQLLTRLEALDGVYRPDQVPVVENEHGELVSGLDRKFGVTGRVVEVLHPEYYPDRPLLPSLEIAHDRIALEVMRGCTAGCRFCHAGMIYRPVRERPVDEVVDQAVKNIEATGYDEISLLSLSTSDYGPLPVLMQELREAFRGKGVSLAFPSLRAESYTETMAAVLPDSRKGGITFAPEAGTARMRRVINKHVNDDDILRAADLAFREGYNGVKLYFMIGLPGERKEDIDGIADLAFRVAKRRQRKSQKVTVSVAPYAPKAQTPYQRFGQESVQSVREKLDYLAGRFRRSPVKFKSHDPEGALIESALARGDRRLARVIEAVWRAGGRLEAWSDQFSMERWRTAFADKGLEPEHYVRARTPGETLPWGHIRKGITDSFFENEARRTELEQVTPDCRRGRCTVCGLARFIPKGQKVCNLYEEARAAKTLTETKRTLPVDVLKSARLQYARHEEQRWTGHLDMVRTWDRLLRRADVPVSYSQGFNPHMRISFGPPLPVGMVSREEYIDMDLSEDLSGEELRQRLEPHLPPGIEIQSIHLHENRPASLQQSIEWMEYECQLPNEDSLPASIQAWMDREEYIVERVKKGKTRQVDIRPFVRYVRLMDGQRLHVRLAVLEGATVRLDELSRAWTGKEDLFAGGCRIAVGRKEEEEAAMQMRGEG